MLRGDIYIENGTSSIGRSDGRRKRICQIKGNLAEEEITSEEEMKNRSQRNVEEKDVLLAQYLMKTQSSGIPIRVQRKQNILSTIEDVI